MQKSHMDVGKRWKIGLCNKKTKIYQTIKGLIILFIKPQFFIRYNQAFRLLRISTSKYLPQSQIIYLNLSFNSYNFITCIIPNIFVSSLIYLMIPDMHLQRSLHLIKLSPGLRIC